MACLASPRDAIELFAPASAADKDIQYVVRQVERSSVESFGVFDDHGVGCIIEGVDIVDEKLLQYLLSVWMTAPIFRCFYGRTTMKHTYSRLSTSEAHEFFCENPCDVEEVEQALEFDGPGWILFRDQYDESDCTFVFFGLL